MKRLLVPTDFSPTAEKAFRLAVELASKIKGSIILYNLYKPADKNIFQSAKTKALYNTQLEKNLLKRLNRLKKKVASEESIVPISTIIGREPVINNILGFAEQNHIEMIVMGTKGASSIKKVLIGSVAAKIANKADIPVLLIPEKFELKTFKNIAFATDYQKPDIQALSFTLMLAKFYNAKVTVFHLLNSYATDTEKKKENNDFETYSYNLQKKFNNHKLIFKTLEGASAFETMNSLDSKIVYDMLVMVRRDKSFYEKLFKGSFTQTMAAIAKKPILIIPEGTTFKIEPEVKIVTKVSLIKKPIIKKIKYKVKS